MRIAIYARVSTEDQAKTGYSLATQIDACEKNVPAGSTIEKFVDEGFSGEFLDRPAMTLLREGISNKLFDMVICYDPDRLARNLAHQLIITDEIEKSGATLEFVSVTFEKSPEGMLFYSIRGAVAAYEKEKIKERVNRGKKAKLASGKLVERHYTYGYDWDKENSNYVINEDQAKVVRLIFDFLLNNGYGTRKIALELNSRGIQSPQGSYWQPTAISRVLNRKAYCGIHEGLKYKYTLDGINHVTKDKNFDDIIEVKTPAIISEDMWNKAQRKIKQNTYLSSRNTKHFYLFQGVLYCGFCYRKMTSNFKRDKKYYYCQSMSLFNVESCGNRLIQSEILDDYIWNTIEKITKDKDQLNLLVAAPKQDDYNKEIIEQEEALIKKRKTIIKWVNSQLITEEEAEPQLENIKAILNEINAKKQNPQKKEVVNVDEIINSAQSATTLEEKRLFVTMYIKKIFIKRIDTGRTEINRKPKFTISIQF